MELKSYRQISRTDWGSEIPADQKPDREQIKLGALLRIADATEVMAKNFTQLQNDYDYMRRDRDEQKKKLARANKSNNAYRGEITKLKKKIAQLQTAETIGA